MVRKINIFLVFAALLIALSGLYSASATNTPEAGLMKSENVISPEYSLSSQPVFSQNTLPIDSSKREMRAVWIATVKNINLTAGMDEAAFKKWAYETCSALKNANYNTVIFQIRPSGDALYNSTLNPWSSYITGKNQGTNPGYDPLAIMVSAAHENSLELHGWINPFRVTMPSDKLSDLSENNIAKKNPSWVIQYGSQHYLDPGIPQVREHLVKSVKEIVDNYDIDAIHIDDYFYPYPVAGETYDDSKSFALYGTGYANLGDFRRDNITKLIRELNKTIKESKYFVQLGISPFGVWRNKATDATGSETNAGHQCYDSLYADTRKWIQEGIIDYITPQIYWSTEFTAANFKVLTGWWEKEIMTQAASRPVNLYIGMADYKVNNNSDTKWNDPSEISNQIEINRASNFIKGQMHYSLSAVMSNPIGYRDIVFNTKYNHIAITPSTYWNNPLEPSLPESLTYSKAQDGIVLNIASKDSNIRKYAIYRYEGSYVQGYDDNKIIGIVYKNGDTTNFKDTSSEKGKFYSYAVRSISNTGVMSNQGSIITSASRVN